MYSRTRLAAGIKLMGYLTFEWRVPAKKLNRKKMEERKPTLYFIK